MQRSLAPIAVLTAGLAAACASTQGPQGSDTRGPIVAPEEAQPLIVVEEPAEGRLWRIALEFGRPVTELRFDRPASFFREGRWSVRTPGWELARRGDLQILRSASAGGSGSVVLEIPVYTAPLPKEYASFVEFSDGSLALYTGHLAGVAHGPAGDSVAVRTFRFEASRDHRTVVPGVDPAQTVVWEDPTGQGTYAYFGRDGFLERSDLVLLMDRGMPPWVASTIQTSIPRFFDLYAERTGVPITNSPVVLVGLTPGGGPGLSSGGGVLPGLIQLALQGDAWAEPSPSAAAHALRFIAHEVAHLWNGDLVRSVRPEQAWMHEGGAEAFADRALLVTGLIDRQELEHRASAALDRCLNLLEGRNLHDAVQAGSHDASYACGQVLSLWTEAALASAGQADLFAFWGALIARARTAGGRYDEALYRDVAAELGVGKAVLDAMAQFTGGKPAPTPRELLVAELRRAGLTVEEDRAPPAAYRESWGRRTMMALMERDCGGASFHADGAVYRIAGGLECGVLREGMEILEVAEMHAVDDGGRAYDRMRELCPDAGVVPVRLADGRSVQAPCPDNLPPRPRPLRIRGLP